MKCTATSRRLTLIVLIQLQTVVSHTSTINEYLLSTAAASHCTFDEYHRWRLYRTLLRFVITLVSWQLVVFIQWKLGWRCDSINNKSYRCITTSINSTHWCSQHYVNNIKPKRNISTLKDQNFRLQELTDPWTRLNIPLSSMIDHSDCSVITDKLISTHCRLLSVSVDWQRNIYWYFTDGLTKISSSAFSQRKILIYFPLKLSLSRAHTSAKTQQSPLIQSAPMQIQTRVIVIPQNCCY